MSLKEFWDSATTRLVAVSSVLILFVLYLIKTWKRAGVDKAMLKERMKVVDDYQRKKSELKEESVEQINAFEQDFQSKMQEIDMKERTILLEASKSKRRLSNAINRSFGR
jgi:biopolymer transport protein ExbB/TolQ